MSLVIGLAPEILPEGTPEERVAFGLFTIRTDMGLLTEGFDSFLGGSRDGPLVSAYYAAEWFAWNWWRLRWEPKAMSAGWDFAHRMNTIGEGYVWPNLTIFSDGERTVLLSHPSARPDAKPFRYFGARPALIPAHEFERAVDDHIGKVVSRLQSADVVDSNLARLWSDVVRERGDPETAQRRRLEALLGRDPDDEDDGSVDRLIADAQRLGAAATDELAADAGSADRHERLLDATALEQIADRRGFGASAHDSVRVADLRLPRRSDVPAWRLGALAAQAVRAQESLSAGAIGDARLAQMAGTAAAALDTEGDVSAAFSFALDMGAQGGKVVLRSKWRTGRRFDLARILGDRLMSADGALYPATRAYTYRQKAQRSFAAELLSPFEAVDEMMRGDYSIEMQQDVADYFDVSSMTINTLLKNHGRIERDDPEQEAFAAAA